MRSYLIRVVLVLHLAVCDVRVTNDWWNTRPRTMNNKGIVDEYRRPKLAYETVKKIFSSVDTYRE